MKRVIITGATGSIGHALVEMLIENDIEVLVICRKNSTRRNTIPQSPLVNVIELDLAELNKLPELVHETYDIFYHLGWDGTLGNARDNIKGQLKNIQYTLDAVEVAYKMGCKRFVGAGSQAEFGRTEQLLNSKVATFPENGYGIAKLCAGQMSRIQCEQFNMEHIWTRILSVYGPYDGMNTMIMSTIQKLLNYEMPQLTEGKQMWDYLYSKDAARAMYLIGDRGKTGKTYCVGSGVIKPLRQYIEKLKYAIIPELQLQYGSIPYSDKQVMYLGADISELKHDTGFEPKYTFEQGIKETIEWVRETYEKD